MRKELVSLVLVMLVAAMAAASSTRFLQPLNLNSILLWVPLLLVVATGQMMVVITRGIDVSVGSILGLAAMCGGLALRDFPQLGIAAALGVSLLVGLASGSLNGALVAFGKVPPIVATLGTLSVYRGLAFIVGKGEQVDSNDLPQALTSWAQLGPLSLGSLTFSWLLAISVLVGLLGHFVLAHTRLGRDIYAVGSNPEGALLRGVPVRRTVFAVYAITGALAGLAGMMYAARFGFVNPATAGAGFELTVIAAVVIGGANVFGGSGTVLGTALGSLLLATINVALAVLGIDANWQMLAYGVVILLAMVLDGALRKVSWRSRAKA